MYAGFKTLTPAARILIQVILQGTNNFEATQESDHSDVVKISSKGIQKNNKLTEIDYLKVLKTKVPKEGVNQGFRAFNQNLYAIEESKRGPDYLYRKRIVCDDGIKTVRIPEPDEL